MTKLLWFLDLNKNERFALAVSKGTSQRESQAPSGSPLSTNDQYCPRLDRTLEVSPLMWRPGPMRAAAA